MSNAPEQPANVVPANTAPTGAVVRFGLHEVPAIDMYTSLSPDNPDHVVMIGELLYGETLDLRKCVNLTIDVEHLFWKPAEFIGDDGELINTRMVWMISPDGKFYRGGGVGLRQSLEIILMLKGLPPWKPSLKLEVRQVETRKGYMMSVVVLSKDNFTDAKNSKKPSR